MHQPIKEHMIKPTIKYFVNNRNGMPHGNLFWDPMPIDGFISCRTSNELREYFHQDMLDWGCYNFYNLCFSLSETLKYETVWQQQEFPVGTLVITPPHKIHRYTEKGYAKDTLIIAFSDNALNFLSDNLRTDFKYSLLLKYESIAIDDEEIRRSFIKLFKEMREDQNRIIYKDKYLLRQKSMLMKIITLLIDQTKTAKPQNNFMTPDQIKDYCIYTEFCKLLDENINTEDGHYVSFYSEKLQIQEKRLTKIVLTNTGRTPKKLITERLEYLSKRYLLGTNKSVKEIASLLGFNTSSRFSVWFKSIEKVSPQKYRDQRN